MVRHLPGLQAGGAAAVLPSDIVPTAGTTTVGTVASSNVAAVWGQDALFALNSDKPATISIDTQAPAPMTRVGVTDYWYRLETLRIGATHRFALFSGGRDVGANAVAGYTPDSYPIEEAARGTLSEKQTITSRIYGGAQADYWLYANAGIDTVRGAPLMVWQDGQNCVGARDLINFRMQTVTDNLVHQKRIPPMVHLLIAPGIGGEKRPWVYSIQPALRQLARLAWTTRRQCVAGSVRRSDSSGWRLPLRGARPGLWSWHGAGRTAWRPWHARDDDHRGPERVQQFEDGEVAVPDRHDGPVRKPAAQGEQHQAGPLGCGAVAAPAPFGPALARSQRGQHWQGPDAARKWPLGQQHGA
jgi:enterochelin esterase family protein